MDATAVSQLYDDDDDGDDDDGNAAAKTMGPVADTSRRGAGAGAASTRAPVLLSSNSPASPTQRAARLVILFMVVGE